MSFCTYCGDAITFRYINGRCIPLHSSGACHPNLHKTFTDFTKEHHALESVCYLTHCPVCHVAVFFVRHNGGSVWLDGPLGAPWHKHACFNNYERNSETLMPESSNQLYPLSTMENYGGSAGVIRFARVMEDHESTECILETGGEGAYFLDIKNNAGYLLGRLCELENDKHIITPSDAPELKYAITKIKRAKKLNTTFCHICRSEISLKKLKKHLRLVHRIQ